MKREFFAPSPEAMAKLSEEKQALFTYKFYLDDEVSRINDKIRELSKQSVLLIDKRSKLERRIEEIITLIIK